MLIRSRVRPAQACCVALTRRGRAACRRRSTRARSAQARCSSGLPGEHVGRRQLRRRGAGRRRLGRAGRPRPCLRLRSRGDGAVLVADDPLPALQQLATAWRERTGREGHRRDRLDRQDLDQGSAARCALAHTVDGRLAGQLQHRDRAAAGDPRRSGRDRGAGSGDGDARSRPDRRARTHRGARRRRDRQHRTCPSRAAGLDRGGRRRQGRADRRARARRDGDRPGRRGVCSTRTCATT